MQILIALLAVGILLTACVKSAPAPTVTPGQDQAVQETGASVEDVQADLNDLDTLDEDLNFSDLDALDEELNFG